jgi:phosphoribosylaminoimidazolecarboxamide formyltransferase / IMP cyclohydrolase
MSPDSTALDSARARAAANGALEVRRALLSVHDKTGLADFARGLVALGVEILSTGGTAALLRESGLAVRDVSEVTGFPEILDGRVKTLHPRIHGGILARRDRPEHLATLAEHGIPPIDLVVISLYPFESTIARPDVTLPEAIEQIDVGGPAMIRAAAKNHAGVAVVTDRSQYGSIVDELRATGGLSAATRAGLAREAFRRTAEYDATIAGYLSTVPVAGPTDARARSDRWPARLRLDLEQGRELRYGENPHQAAAFYRLGGALPSGIAAMKQLHGPELGYNNLLDFAAALGLLLEFDEPAAVVIKHTNPCGVAVAAHVGTAMEKAKASDPVSIYGGIVGANRPVDPTVVRALAGIFVEILFAPAFEPEALEALRRTKKKCRVLEVPCHRAGPESAGVEYRSVPGGVLVQSADRGTLDEASLEVVSRRAPTAAEARALAFAWRVAKHVKSNAIVLATGDQVVGVGAGQMNRLDAARLAVARARAAGLEPRGTVCASDAFFPFRDALDVVAEAGATAAIHPGGSVRDEDVVAAANEHGMAMVTTGIRHFRH